MNVGNSLVMSPALVTKYLDAAKEIAKHAVLWFARGVTAHLESIDAKYDSLIRQKIEEQLKFEPGVETKNRKPLRQPTAYDATWEIRFGPNNRFRVLYGIDPERREVQVQAIGVKKGSRLLVGGEEIEL